MHNRGFSLIELAIVTMIIGILLVPLLSMYQASTSGGAIKQTAVNLQKTSESLSEFVGNNDYYPCPASLIIGPGEPNYGMPDCRDGNGYSGFTAPTTPGDCFAGICRAVGRDGVHILIGAVPEIIMNSGRDADVPNNIPQVFANSEPTPSNQTLDGWGRRLTYAVSEPLTDPTTYSPYSGVISVVDERGMSVLEDPGTAHFVLVSHGNDGAGGYSREGTLIDDCHIGSTDGRNCQHLGTFVSGLRSLNPGPDYYDDMVKHVSFTSSTIWANVDQFSMYNAPGGRVAVGKQDATARLDVEGNLQAVQLHTANFCGQGGSSAPNECYNPALIAGNEPAMECPAGQVMTGIANGQRVCATIPPVNMNANCPSGQVVVGISNLGNVRCCPVSPTGVLQCPN